MVYPLQSPTAYFPPKHECYRRLQIRHRPPLTPTLGGGQVLSSSFFPTCVAPFCHCPLPPTAPPPSPPPPPPPHPLTPPPPRRLIIHTPHATPNQIPPPPPRPTNDPPPPHPLLNTNMARRLFDRPWYSPSGPFVDYYDPNTVVVGRFF